MNWYYLVDSEQQGPIEDSEFARLVKSGTITEATLLWREGLSEWKPYRELCAASVQAETSRLGGQCIECGGAFRLDELVRVGTGYTCATCKPVAMQKAGEHVGNVTSHESVNIRNIHLKHEAAVRSIGLLYFLGGTVMILAGVMGLFSGETSTTLAGVLLLVLGFVQFWVGRGLRRLQSWARIPTGVLSGLGLLGFPIGTLINAYILYLVFSQKGATVFSPRYQQVIAATPHIKYRTSIVIWILLGLVILLVAAAVIYSVFGQNK
jgi:hypothetical protein